uniref:EF-hand domain-containing protein n=1 Tax=Anopheles epiroticus TaxID=199890 RepID=A0A182P246_9DIPT
MAQDCPNGKLTPAKFVDMYKMFFPSGNAEEFCDHVFRTFDMDKNGYIDFKHCEVQTKLVQREQNTKHMIRKV